MTDYPDPATAVKLALDEGVSGITVHLREDRRHIQEEDVRKIRAIKNCKLNLEMAAQEEIIEIALDIMPDQVTLVPESREELTTEGGLDVASQLGFYNEISRRFDEKKITVSFFIDPSANQIEAAATTKAPAVELNTGKYSEAKTEKEIIKSLRQIKEGVKTATACGLTVHAGHGLNYKNIVPVAEIEGIDEFNIGHSIVSHAVFVGFPQAVRLMMELIKNAAKKQRRKDPK